VKLSFCMIVFNEARTLKANLAHLYPHAHEIIICEGSVEALRLVAGVGPRSDDGTLELLKSFPDPDRKLRILQRDWTDKNEMASAYAEYSTGDLVWHVDADEFYDPYSLRAVPRAFRDPELTTLAVPMYVFWMSPDFVLADADGDDRWFCYARVLRRTDGMSVSHLPIRRIIHGQREEQGLRRPRDSNITAWHYAWNDDARVRLKLQLYQQRDAGSTRANWLAEVWDRWSPDSPPEAWPDGVHPSRLWHLWPRRFAGRHPECVQGLLDGLRMQSTARGHA